MASIFWAWRSCSFQRIPLGDVVGRQHQAVHALIGQQVGDDDFEMAPPAALMGDAPPGRAHDAQDGDGFLKQPAGMKRVVRVEQIEELAANKALSRAPGHPAHRRAGKPHDQVLIENEQRVGGVTDQRLETAFAFAHHASTQEPDVLPYGGCLAQAEQGGEYDGDDGERAQG
jgi:hypothetical protein